VPISLPAKRIRQVLLADIDWSKVEGSAVAGAREELPQPMLKNSASQVGVASKPAADGH